MDSKRAFDFIVAGLALIILSPILAALALSTKLDSPGPIIFSQIRVGRQGRHFTILKFRTMAASVADPGPQITVGNDARITRTGAVLRKWKLDELPQLWNVVVGEMSIVGPRPEVPQYVEYYPEDIRAIVLSVRPGITDPGSIRFRNESDLLATKKDPTSFYIHNLLPEKLEIYTQYVANRSFFNDLKIIFRTLFRIVKY